MSIGVALVCPSCRTLAAGLGRGSDAAPCCAATPRHDGVVYNAAGVRPHRFDMGAEPVVAARLVNQYAARYGGVGGDYSDAPIISAATATAVARAAGLTDTDIAYLQHSVPFIQISNNLRDYFAAAPYVSKTTAYFRSQVALVPGDRLLDIGCSAGRSMLAVAAPGAMLTGIDLDLLALHTGAAAWTATAKQPTPAWIAADLMRMPFENGAFTHAVSSVVLGLVPLRSALREIGRVLVPGGTLAFTIEGTGFIDELWQRQPGWGPRQLRSKQGLLRWRLAHRLMQAGIEWQGRPGLGRLAGLATYTPDVLAQLVPLGGFKVEEISVLQEFNGKPRVIGVRARKVS